ncbi:MULTISPECIES: response regulator transcription factor [unclassified Novosphingobium]|uniref:response regulator transcription factor n=1 Tax=unclassified Novosphingobium TaxID=2644732 RepID=UPI00144714B5|nr:MULTISPECIES: response regulator transcription factor [unclassified Novosphingobium]NKJ43841.1 two-component system KDP operon response regulator KdpE [Novosphingobium sp. SG720]NMN06304.1 two-component system KDP operon response regulator KdpE [Novosphingobium sp. SG919]NMN88602.1 two-component system KDP operon response regulator KdpE [Novosphingobium sp. SG916]
MSGVVEAKNARVLVVDDDPAIRALLHHTLGQAGYVVSEAASAAQALDQRAAQAPDLALLDLGLPDRDGLEILPQLVAAGLAVVVLSARDATAEKVAALDLGASDYVTKPFDPDEILARVRTALRHRARLAGGAGAAGGALLRFADVEIDLAARQVRKAGVEVHLAPKEYAFLAELAGHAGRVVTHAQLLRTIWGPGHETDVEYLRVAARGIRRKLESDRPPGQSALRNEPGIGYRLDLARG